jgi:CubicO group peptidase (beta-lactamase class C family)
MTGKLSNITGLFILSLITVSCIIKDSSEKIKRDKLKSDSEVLKDSTRSIISRIDNTKIKVSLLDTRINSLLDSAKVTGLALSIFNENQIIYSKAFGYANYHKKTSLQINNTFYGASLSKAVFGYIVANLINDSIFDLDKPLQQYLDITLPELKANDKWHGFQDLKDDKRYETITARMCMSHTTGFQNWRWIQRPGDTENPERLKIYFDPGTQYFYSGEGIMLLQYVIERITGKNLEQLASELVFEPLQMRNTSYVWQDRFEDNYCYGHTTNQEVIAKDKRDEAQAAGSMETNLIDYSIFVKHLLQLNKEKSTVTNMMFTPNFRIRTKAQFGPLSVEQTNENDSIQLSYGLGWGLLQSPFGLGAFKEGHGEGFQHYTIIFPEKEIGIVILSNSDNAEGIFKKLLEITIADIYTPWKWENYIPYMMRSY